MKPDTSEKKEPQESILFLLLKLFFFVIGLQLLVPLLTVGLQGLIWRYYLSRVDGIDFNGGLWEACALSFVLGVSVFTINLLIGMVMRRVNRMRGVEKPHKPLETEFANWEDLQKVLPTFATMVQQFLVYFFSLFVFAVLQPVHLHFDGLFQLCLTTLLLSTSSSVVGSIAMLGMYAFIIKMQKSKVSPA